MYASASKPHLGKQVLSREMHLAGQGLEAKKKPRRAPKNVAFQARPTPSNVHDDVAAIILRGRMTQQH